MAAAEAADEVEVPEVRGQVGRADADPPPLVQASACFEKGRAREPGPLVEEAIQAAVSSDSPEAIGRVYELAGVFYRKVEPAQIHQAIVSRFEADQEELEPLRIRAKEQNAGLCPRCASQVPSPVPVLPPPLIVSHGRLSGEGFSLDLGPVLPRIAASPSN